VVPPASEAGLAARSGVQPRNYARITTGRGRNIGPFAGYAGCGAGERSETGRLHAVEPPSASEVDLGAARGAGTDSPPPVVVSKLRAELSAGQEKGARSKGVFASSFLNKKKDGGHFSALVERAAAKRLPPPG
jgi:hypothetical protein